MEDVLIVEYKNENVEDNVNVVEKKTLGREGLTVPKVHM